MGQTQQLLAQHAVRPVHGPGKLATSPLAGKLIDEKGIALTPTHAVKNRRRHRYYVSRPLLTEGARAIVEGGWRLPARETEQSVAAAAACILEDKTALVTAIQEKGIEADRIVSILEQASAWAVKLSSSAYAEALASLVDRVDLRESGFKLSVRVPISQVNSKDTLKLEKQFPVRMKKRGVELKLVIGNQPSSGAKVDLVLLKTIDQTH